MLPMGMIEIRLKYVREEIKKREQELKNLPHDAENKPSLKRAIDSWKVAEHELMLMLAYKGVDDDWVKEAGSIHMGKANRGELETDSDKIYKRFLHEFGLDNSWYAQLVCSWLHVANHNTMPLPDDEGTFYKALHVMNRINERIEHRNKGFYDCMGCRSEKNRYHDGYNNVKGNEYCDECAKKVESEACSGCGLTYYCDCKDGEETALKGITEEQYLEALKVYLDHAYPDDQPIWTIMNGERKIIDLETPAQRRHSIFLSASKEPHKAVFFKDGIPPSITFGSWIQPHMKLRYDDGELWVESNEDSKDGKPACEMSRELKHTIEHAWQKIDWIPTIDGRVHYLENSDSEETLCCILLDEGKKIFSTTEINKVDCSHCRKILIHKGLMFDNRTKRDCQKCLHPHQQSERTGEALGCTKAGCGCKDFDDGE